MTSPPRAAPTCATRPPPSRGRRARRRPRARRARGSRWRRPSRGRPRARRRTAARARSWRSRRCRRRDQRLHAGAVAADHVDVLDGADRADGLDVRRGPAGRGRRPAAARVGCGERAYRERRDRRRAHVGERDAVDQRDRRERGRVEDHADALDARLAADGHELDHRWSAVADGITSSSPAPTASAPRGGSASGSRPASSAASARRSRPSGSGARRRRPRRGRAGSSQDEAGAQRVARVEDEAVLARAVGHPLDLGEHALGRPTRPRGREGRADDGVVAQDVALAEAPVGGQQRERAEVPDRTASGRPRRRRRSSRCAGAAAPTSS